MGVVAPGGRSTWLVPAAQFPALHRGEGGAYALRSVIVNSFLSKLSCNVILPIVTSHKLLTVR